MVEAEKTDKQIDLNSKSESKKRVEYLDIIKAISILLVVFCHVPLLKADSVLDNITMIVCWSAVPCFFLTTGALYLNKEWDFKKFIKRLLNIYLVMCVWKIIYLVVYHFKGTVDILTTSKRSIFNYIFLFTGLNGVEDSHFWFMYAYLSVFLIYPFFNVMFKNIGEYKNFLIFIMIFIFFATTLTYTFNFIFEYFHIENIQISNIKNKLVYGNYSFVLIYFLMGGFLYKYNVYEKYTDKKILIRIISILLMILGIIGLVLMKKHFDGTFKWKNIYLKDAYHCTSTLLLSLGIFLFFQGTKIKFKILSKILSEVGKNTIGIFYLHILILELVKIIKINYSGSLINLLKSIIVIAISYIIIVIIKKIPILKKIV